MGLFSRKRELAAEKRVTEHYRSLWLQSLDDRAETAKRRWNDDFQLRLLLTQEQIKNGKLRKAIHDAVGELAKVAPVDFPKPLLEEEQ